MRDDEIRRAIHRAVDADAEQVKDDPYLAARVLALGKGKETTNRMKRKLPFGVLLAVILICASLTAVAVGLTLRQIWDASFEKMNTRGDVWLPSEPQADDMSVDEAIALARAAIQAKYATPDAELDAMGVYPTFMAEDHFMSNDRDKWSILLSSRTNANLDVDTGDYGPLGEYRVYIDGDTGEITLCHWYTNDFWSAAQRIWDEGDRDVVAEMCRKASFYSLSLEMQAHFNQLLVEAGYTTDTEADKYLDVLDRVSFDVLRSNPWEYALAADDPQCTAAWAALQERFHIDRSLMEKYCYRARKIDLQTGTEDIVISFILYEADVQRELMLMQSDVASYLDDAMRMGTYMVSFAPGTTQVQRVTHLLYSRYANLESITEGALLAKNDWTADDLAAYDAHMTALSDALDRMTAANCTWQEMIDTQRAHLAVLGHPNRSSLMENPDYDWQQWFEGDAVEDKERQARIAARMEYGDNWRYWPLAVQAELLGSRFDMRMPREGDMTEQEAADYAIEKVVNAYGQSALDALGDYTVGVTNTPLSNHVYIDTLHWTVRITGDPVREDSGWRVTFMDIYGEGVDDPAGTVDIKDIGDRGNG